MPNAGITGVGSYLPPGILTNHDLEKMVDTSDEWITTRTGIKERRIASEDQAASDLAVKAAEKALEDAQLDAKQIDLIIVATVTPDMFFPATACLVQQKIGAINAAAFDLEAGCSGFIYALSVATQFVNTGVYQNVLVIGAETLSKITDWSDRNTCVLFGDGAGAVVVSNIGDENKGILANYLKADGSGGKLLHMPAGGSRLPATKDTVEKGLHYINMNGGEVFKFAVKIMGCAAKNVIKLAGLKLSDVDYLVPHQANKRIVDAAIKRLKLSPDRVYMNLDRYGNMSSASIPVALDEAVKKGFIKKGDIVLMVGFGAGLTWGASVLRWIK